MAGEAPHVYFLAGLRLGLFIGQQYYSSIAHANYIELRQTIKSIIYFSNTVIIDHHIIKSKFIKS